MDGKNYRVPDTRGVFMRGMDPGATRDTNRPAGSVQLDMLAYDGGNVNEIGIVAHFAANKPPANWLVCDGAVYAINLYQPLYNVIGNLYGGVSGSTFAVPDLRGQFIRGVDRGANVDAGRTLGSAQADTIQNITGRAVGMYYGNVRDVSGAMGGSVFNIGRGQTVGNGGGNGDAGHVDFDASRSVRTSGETRPKNVALLPCIRFR
jgi:microcystin-dependent protein